MSALLYILESQRLNKLNNNKTSSIKNQSINIGIVDKENEEYINKLNQYNEARDKLENEQLKYATQSYTEGNKEYAKKYFDRENAINDILYNRMISNMEYEKMMADSPNVYQNLQGLANNRNQEIKQKLNNYYNYDFNRKLDMTRDIDRQIYTQSQIIDMNRYSLMKKENTISLLRNILLLTIFCIFPVYGYLTGIITGRFAALVIVLAIIIFAAKIIYNYYQEYKFKQTMLDANKKTAKELYKKNRIYDDSEGQCPSLCSVKENTDTELIPAGSNNPLHNEINDQNMNRLITDDTENVWVDGYDDVPSINSEAMPTYKCRNRQTGRVIETNIPCEYHMDMEEI